jgi:hypothetical protein
MKKFYSFILTATLSFIFSAGGTAVCAQELVAAARNGTMTAAQINQRIKTVFGANAPAPTTENVDLYKINYRSTDENNRAVTLSGLVALPRGGAPKGLVVFNHGTLADRRKSPSRFAGKADSSETELAILAFASGGYAVAIPDYLGLGDHQAAHPYPLGAVNSHSAVDVIAPTRSLAARQKTSIGAQLYVSGYSEGGAIGMWTVRDLEQKANANNMVSAAALMSGPYDISGVTRNSLIAPTDNQTTFVTRLYLIAYMVNYFHRSKGLKLTDYFKPAMALTVSQAFKGNITDENIIKRLALAAVLMRSKNSIDNVITTRFKRAMETLDTNEPIVRELQKQDVYDWSPRTKMLLVNLKKDNVVDPANTDKAITVMRRRGIGANSLRQYVINDEKLNHLTAVAPALAQARRFFDEGFTNDR